ncbi:MAG: hypothetical protein HPY82_23640 [Gammaproteobacteria bacterium]|nr:hypothetical protein [Gammaproteobacteria bacterium]
MRQAVITEKSQAKYHGWLNEIARREAHVPFLGIRDTWKIGRRHLHLEPGSKCLHLSASDLELRCMTFLRYKFRDASFKTQVALPLEQTIKIANELGVIHPRDWEENEAKTMSTDIVMEGVDRKTGEKRHIAVFVRYLEGLYKIEKDQLTPITREWQKISIYEIYHTQIQKQEFCIITDRELSKDTEYSIRWLNYSDYKETSENKILAFVETFLEVFENNRLAILNDLLELTASKLGLSFSQCLNLFRMCGQQHYLPLDISRRITLSSTIGMNYDEIF